jgi:DNA-binding NtrC family response regulator
MKMKRMILLASADDERMAHGVVELVRRGFSVSRAASLEGLLQACKEEPIDIIVVDEELLGSRHFEIIEKLTLERSELCVALLCTGDEAAQPPPPDAAAIFGYLSKPLSVASLVALVERAHGARAVAKPGPWDSGANAVWSPATATVYEALRRAAARGVSVLITGETGSGKEVAARTYRGLSHRKEKPFVSVNCAALSPALLESELFGHEKGAFTSATERRVGRFEAAHGGILLLDEVGELGPDLQAKLLRVLQEHAFERVGSSQTIQSDVVVIATTNRDLKAEMAANRFRQDLYYRLNVIQVEVPPLRDRRSEIPLLVTHILRKKGRENHLAPESIADLCRHEWPGNVRELENLLERWITLGGSLRSQLKSSEGTPDQKCHARARSGLALRDALEEAERAHLELVLGSVGGNRRQAARVLAIDRNTLRAKLQKYGLDYAPIEVE